MQKKVIPLLAGLFSLLLTLGAFGNVFARDLAALEKQPLLSPKLTAPFAYGVYMFGRTTAGTYQADNCTNSAASGCTAPKYPSAGIGVFDGFANFATQPAVPFAEEPSVENFFYNQTDTNSSIMVVGRGTDNSIYYSYGGGGTSSATTRTFLPFTSLDNGQGITFKGRPALARVCGANASACNSLFVIARGDQGGVVNDYWYRIFSRYSSSWATAWIRLGAYCQDDPVAVAPNYTTSYNLLYLYCRGGDNALYVRSLVLQRPYDGNNSLPKPSETAIAANSQWEGMPDSINMVMTPSVTHMITSGGQDQLWAFVRGGTDNAVYYTVMNSPSSPTCTADPAQGGNLICKAPARFTYDSRGNFVSVGGQLTYAQNGNGSFYNGVPGGTIKAGAKPMVGWLRPDSGYPGAVMMVGLGNDTAYYYAYFKQDNNQWHPYRGIPNTGGFVSDPEVNDANHYNIRIMGRAGTDFYYNYYSKFTDQWASDGLNQPYFNMGSGFTNKPVLFNND